jgi:mycofactocin system glycosyltransferase
MKYQLARHVELVERNNELLLVSRAPLCVLRLNLTLHELVRRGLDEPIDPATPAEEAVLEQLVTKGFATRLRHPATQDTVTPTISIVIPVKDRAGELRRCLDSIHALNYPKQQLQLIVVDDGSCDDSAAVAKCCGAMVIPSGGSGRGPAAARNVGARAASGEMLAFIDSDCTASSDWLAELLPVFVDPQTAAVGGLVDGMCLDTVVDRYESTMSSLSLGKREQSGNSGDDTFYLPSCNLLVRRSAFMAVGCFKDEMHVGEDVDLTWRLRDNGWTIRYLPVGRVFHAHRSTVRSFMPRRFDYGTSEGLLQRLHPHRQKRMVVPPLLGLLLLLCLVAPITHGWSLALAAGMLSIDVLCVQRRLTRRGMPLGLPTLLAGRLRALGSLAYYLSYHLIRYYSIPLLLLGLLFPLSGAVLLAALLGAATVDHAVRKPSLGLLAFVPVYFIEQLAYGAGAFWGCLSRKTFASYRVLLLGQMKQPA